jgi:hypothetical protein
VLAAFDAMLDPEIELTIIPVEPLDEESADNAPLAEADLQFSALPFSAPCAASSSFSVL